MENTKLHIEWTKGYMDINLEEFFPCSEKRLKKLFGIIDMDKNAKELKKEVERFLEGQLASLPDVMNDGIMNYHGHAQKEAELNVDLAVGRYGKGEKYESAAELKAEISRTASMKNNMLIKMKSCRKKIKQVEKCLTVVYQMNDRGGI